MTDKQKKITPPFDPAALAAPPAYHPTLLTAATSRPVVCEPDPRLHQPSDPIPEVTDTTRQLMHDMLRTMYEHSGIGLTAVQIGVMQQVIVIDIDRHDVPAWLLDSEERDNALPPAAATADTTAAVPSTQPLVHGGQPLFLVNAEIIESSNDTQTFFEGCLSIPYVGDDVTRPRRVKVRYLDYAGQQQEQWFGPGLIAACVQHEIDHAGGRLYWDHLSPLKRDRLVRKMKKIIRNQN